MSNQFYKTSSVIRIMVVDDQHLVRRGLSYMLADIPGFELIAEAESGEQAVEKIRYLLKSQQRPDVILMDLRMPGIGGLEATRKITRRYPDIKIIAVTGCNDSTFTQRFLESGASGFITKDAVIEEVGLAIRTVHRGRRYISQEVAQDMALTVSIRSTNDASPFEHLSDRELQIAKMVVSGTKTACIAEQLHVSPKTVNTYRYRLFDKLNINNNMELALLASRYGLLETVAPHEYAGNG